MNNHFRIYFYNVSNIIYNIFILNIILTHCIKNVLMDAINNGGTTLNDFSNVDGNPEYFSQVLNVYGRDDMPCMRCHGTIKRIVQNQRATYYCPKCQH